MKLTDRINQIRGECMEDCPHAAKHAIAEAHSHEWGTWEAFIKFCDSQGWLPDMLPNTSLLSDRQKAEYQSRGAAINAEHQPHWAAIDAEYQPRWDALKAEYMEIVIKSACEGG